MAKFFIQVSGFSGTPEMADGSLKFMVEWKRLSGARDGGKTVVFVEHVGKELSDELREQMADYLSGKFAPEIIRTRDVVCLG